MSDQLGEDARAIEIAEIVAPGTAHEAKKYPCY